MVTGKDYKECEEMFKSQSELQISLPLFEKGAGTLVQ